MNKINFENIIYETIKAFINGITLIIIFVAFSLAIPKNLINEKIKYFIIGSINNPYVLYEISEIYENEKNYKKALFSINCALEMFYINKADKLVAVKYELKKLKLIKLLEKESVSNEADSSSKRNALE